MGKKNPRYVVRFGGSWGEYMQPDGSRGDYKTAKRFRDQDKATEAAEKHIPSGDYGIFPCSVQR